MADIIDVVVLGPEHHGQRMSLEEFARAEVANDGLFELERGVVIHMATPRITHGYAVKIIRDGITLYEYSHPGVIRYVGGGSEAGVCLPGMQSERHPDLSIYLSPPPPGEQPWEFWSPDWVVEVVSEGGEQRDYRLKAEEYLDAGVKVYWIVDPRDQSVTVLTRRGDTWVSARHSVRVSHF